MGTSPHPAFGPLSTAYKRPFDVMIKSYGLRKPGAYTWTGPPGTSLAWLSPLLPPNGSFASLVPTRVSSSRVGKSYVELPIILRLMDRIVAERAYSGKDEKLFDGAPMFVLPPIATNNVLVTGSSCNPL